MRIAIGSTLIAMFALAPASSSAQLIAEQNGVDLTPMFEARGFRDVEVLRRRIDRIEAEACRGSARWKTTLFLLSGRVEATERLGDCVEVAARSQEDEQEIAAPRIHRGEAGLPPAHDAEDAAMRALERVGYTGVRIRRWGREGWRGTACRDGSLREVRVSLDNIPAAPLRAMRACPPGRDEARVITREKPEPPIRHVRDVKARLIKRGYNTVGRIEIKDGAFHAEACEKGWTFVITMDPKGEIVRRRNVGRCEESGERVTLVVPAAGASE